MRNILNLKDAKYIGNKFYLINKRAKQFFTKSALFKR